MNPDKALKLLNEGNQRYVKATDEGTDLSVKTTRLGAEHGQKPFAIIVGCSDSRVPAELVFNQGLGDLFVIRVAGNVVTPSQIGSVEFACQNFGTRLVVVLGHSHCGAIKATIDSIGSDLGNISPNVASIVERVMPAVQPIQANQDYKDKDDLVHKAMRANVEQSVDELHKYSDVLRNMVDKNEIKIIGAEYLIESGEVNFYTNNN